MLKKYERLRLDASNVRTQKSQQPRFSCLRHRTPQGGIDVLLKRV
jgi:hypothetical protein